MQDSSLSPPPSNMPTPPARRSVQGAAGDPSPLRQAIARFSPPPQTSGPSRKRQLSSEKDIESRPGKVARRGKAKASDDMDVDVGGNEEVVVEDMVPGVDSEEMTPVPGEGEEEGPEAEEEYPEQGDEEEEEVVVAEEEEAVEEEDDGDDKFAPGTLGKLPFPCGRKSDSD
jgi:hypothetical protein